MAGFWDDVLGFDDNNRYNPWLAQIAINNQKAAADKAAADALLAQQTATPAATTPAATTTTPAATTPASVFDATPYRGTVDTAFSQFTPEWYANQYGAVYNPYKSGVENQFNTAKDFLTSGLAKKGQQNSSLGSSLFQQLDALRDQTLQGGQTEAENWQKGLEKQVGDAKTSLYGTIKEGADNATIGTRAQAAASPIYGSKAPASTLGQDVFGGLVAPYATAQSPGGPSNPNDMAFATGSELNLAGGGSGPGASTKVIGNKKKKF